MSVTQEQSGALVRVLRDSSPVWCSTLQAAQVLEGAGVPAQGSYWLAKNELERLESEGLLERLYADGGKHHFEWWRWNG